ncbi:thiamine-phosphate kinase [Chitinilyticum piscinae]|uniref:Thiamine-monophosphate kinase n=1 Tax=Chitinilyticum piscinae TaxID=2866724 RepID=A0A8J7FIY5_9NEIS|nr:thiamine-phosphate kinase [Chitinilyticum piscinae]MBE9608672.1 thiamine-phosphate kinase [Chitinilyticum piscinae]
MNEFGLIARYFTRPAANADLGVGDDCALMRVREGMQLAVSVDMLVSGRHFFADVDPQSLGHKALAVNLSDLAAMGAEPRWFTLSLALPELDEGWLAGFSAGLHALADQHGISLVGGDTTKGPLTLSIQVAGELPAGSALLRSAGQPGDDLWVSGELGAAAAAVMHGCGRFRLPDTECRAAYRRLEWPTPRVELGLALRGVAHAALDISDGLAGDLRHICARSACGAELWLEALPASDCLAVLPETLRREALLSGGDDYELCFSAPAVQREHLAALAAELGVPLTRIGRLVAGSGVQVLLHGEDICWQHGGFDHFGAA